MELALSTRLYTLVCSPGHVRSQHLLCMAACSAVATAVPRWADVGLFHPEKVQSSSYCV